MSMRALKTVSVAVLLNALLAGCAHFRDERDVPLKTGPRLIERATAPYYIAPLDKVSFVIQGQTMELSVDHEGMLALPSGNQKVEGMLKERLIALVKAAYPGARNITVTFW